MRRAARREWLGVTLLHGVLTAWMTWPALTCFSRDFFGAPRGDKYLFLWVFWWVDHALRELHQLPFFSPLQYHPTGVSVALHDMTYFWSLLAIPLGRLLDPGIVLNLFLLICFPLNGLACYYLAREVTGSRVGALAGSVVFAFCPYQLARFQLSQISLLGVFFVPLFLLALWRYARDGRGRRLALAGIWLALQSLTSWYYGVALGLVFAAFALRRAIAVRRSGRDLGRLALHAAALAASAGILLAPFVAPIVAQVGSGGFEAATARSDPHYLEASSGDLRSYFVPNVTSAAWRGWEISDATRALRDELRTDLLGNVVEKAVYPGWISWIALAAALATPALRRRYAPWIALSLSSFVLSLGPTLQVGGATHLEGWLPARLLMYAPVLDLVRGPVRFAPFLTLGSAVVLAGGVDALARARGAATARVVSAAAVVLAVVEFTPAPVPTWPQDTWHSAFYETLRDEPGDGVVLNVPVDFEGALGGGDLYGYAQTLHRKPIVGGYVSREPDAVMATLRESAFLRAIHQRQYEDDKRLRLGEDGRADMRATLERLGVRWVIVHRALLRGSEWKRVNDWLAPELGEPIHEDRWIRVYRFVSGVAPGSGSPPTRP